MIVDPYLTSFSIIALNKVSTKPGAAQTEVEGTSTWNWGASAAAHNIGRLASVSGPGYSEAYTYDTNGRIKGVTYTSDATYQVDYAYNANSGYLDNVTYPTSTAGYRLRPQFQYQYGTLVQVTDFASPSTVWWKLNAEDDRGNPVDEQLANGVHILANNDPLTGHLNWRTSGTNTQFNNQQNITYQWDKNENLTDRIDVNQANLTEHFYYDALDRLDRSTLNGTTNLDVTLDAAGNISAKTGLGDNQVGTYTYHATRKHAVASTSNGWSFSYDGNGNMQTGRGATIHYTSYNLPDSITNGTLSNAFSYTPDRNYWKQIANYSNGQTTTIYVGGLLEKVVTATDTVFRHMITAGSATIIVSRAGSGANSTYYVTRDNVSSSASVTSSTGASLVNESFGSYGNRRGTNWQGQPSSGDLTAISSTTRHGFTGHNMLDNTTLVHMNGRVYDPLLGRVLSPDPIVQSLSQSQSLNPYSYAWNNPLKYTDPSGYSLKRFFKKAFKRDTHWLAPAFLGTSVGSFASTHWLAWQGGQSTDHALLKNTWLQPIALAAACYFGTAYGCAAASAHLSRINGGSVGQIALAGLGGYIAGGGLGDSLGARALGGSINGYAQAGTDGMVRGMLAAVIPADLGMGQAYMNNAWANAAINVARDGITGYVIDGKDGAQRSIYAGLFNNAVGHTVGLISSGGEAPHFANGAWNYNAQTLPNASAITFGNVLSYDEGFMAEMDVKQPGYAAATRVHETGHYLEQYTLNMMYLPMHALSQGALWLARQRYPTQKWVDKVAILENQPYITTNPYFNPGD